MKKKIKLWWPVQAMSEEEVEIDIAEGIDPDEWLLDNEERLIEEASHGDHDGPLDIPLDIGSAGAKFVE